MHEAAHAHRQFHAQALRDIAAFQWQPRFAKEASSNMSWPLTEVMHERCAGLMDSIVLLSGRSAATSADGGMRRNFTSAFVKIVLDMS